MIGRDRLYVQKEHGIEFEWREKQGEFFGHVDLKVFSPKRLDALA